MGGLAGIVRWRDNVVKEQEIRLMLDCIPHRAPDGNTIDLSPGTGFGHACLALTERDRLNSGIFWNHDETLGIVADARIYNRGTLQKALALNAECGDAELILTGYIKWGRALLDKLEGDFSFAIMNRVKNEVFAARDIIGAKPFFYLSFPDRFVFSSEPKQILGFPFGVRAQPDRLEVGRYLVNQLGARERTVWKSIKRLKPGHYLSVMPGQIEQKAYWIPNSRIKQRFSNYQGYIDLIKQKLMNSVSSRLESESKVAIHVSGGYDSSSLALIADELAQEERDQSHVSLIGLSVSYEEKEVDESRFIKSVGEKLSFPIYIYEAPKDDDRVDIASQVWQLDSPVADLAISRDIMGMDLIKEKNGRVLIMGFGGDDVFWEPDYGKDLLRQGRILRFLSWCFDCTHGNPFSCVKGKLREYLDLNFPKILVVYSWLLRRKHKVPEKLILAEDLRELVSSKNANGDNAVSGHFDSYAQKQLFGWMTSSLMQWNVEHLEVIYAYHGIEVRHPYLDKTLMEVVLSVPLNMRLKNKKRLKPLLQDLMTAGLPELVLNRNNKVSFDRYFLNLFNTWSSPIKNIVFSCKDLEVNSFLEKDSSLCTILQKVNCKFGFRAWSQVRLIWTLFTLEMWLNTIEKYNER